jgi:hypothetical protein
LVISPFANLSFNIVFTSFSEVDDVLDLANPEARDEMNAPVIPIHTSIIMPPIIHPSVVAALGPNVEVVAVCNVHHSASPILAIPDCTSERSDL